jgi:hypothetical protein
VTFFVLLPAAARTQFVAADLGTFVTDRFRFPCAISIRELQVSQLLIFSTLNIPGKIQDRLLISTLLFLKLGFG